MEVINKSFGIDQATGLEKTASFSRLIIDLTKEVIEIQVDINLIYPSGKKQKINNVTYRRFNADGNMKFNLLKDSLIGQGIINLVSEDFQNIKSFETMEADLAQISIPPEIADDSLKELPNNP